MGGTGGQIGISVDDGLDDDQSFDRGSAESVCILSGETSDTSEVQVQAF
jgi:hypothetical protein